VPGVAIDRARIVATWHEMLPFMREAPFGERPGDGLRYGFDNPAYSWGDGSVLHAMLRLHRPRRLIEIGSGWSSACALDTIERCLDGACEATFIEPYPALLRELIGEPLGEAAARVTIVEAPVQACPPEIFDALAAGDLLFIDSTHVMKTGSDVCFELFEVLPRLAAGVLVHIHDMFWPFEYPRAWAVDENRSWNELYAVRAFLMHTAAWEVLFFNDMMAKLERPLAEATYPRFLRNPGGGLWLRRR
jgi:hypothetical protein